VNGTLQDRLQKIIARAGIVSRRTAEQYIREGRVSVNRKVVTQLGAKADPGRDEIRVDGRLIPTRVEKLYLMLHKPQGYVTSLKDPEGRPIVTDLLRNVRQRVYPVGRLDYDSEGLLILTNDGDFAQCLQHPRHEIRKTYLVKVRGSPTPKALRLLQEGVDLEDGLFVPRAIRQEKTNPKSSWFQITVSEGRNRVIRRAFDVLGHPVQRLIRIAMGNLMLGDLAGGEYRPLTKREIEGLLSRARNKKDKNSLDNPGKTA
jgi:23S rRNA pseudouridine2605 synthase